MAIQLVCSVAVVVLLLLVLTTVTPERYKEELEEVVKDLQTARKEVDEVLDTLRSLGDAGH